MLKLVLIFFIALTSSCSKNFKEANVNLIFPKNIAKIEGEHAIFIKDDNFLQKRDFKSDDCDSWAVDLKLQELFDSSFLRLSDMMFKNLTVFRGKSIDLERKLKQFKTIIIIEKNLALTSFSTIGNNGIFNIKLNSNFRIKSGKNEIKTNVQSEQNWKKNIFLNCKLVDGSKKASEEAFKSLLNQAYNNIYASVFSLSR